MRKQSRRRIKIIVFFYLFLFFFLLNNPEFSHFRARCGTAWNAASTFRAAIKRNGRQFDRGCERKRERITSANRRNFLSFLEPRTRCEFTNHVCTRVHVASGLSNARNLSLSPLPRLRSMPSTATIYDHRASYATLPFQRRNRKRKGARDAISRCGERLGGIEVTKGNKFKWARLIVQDKRV